MAIQYSEHEVTYQSIKNKKKKKLRYHHYIDGLGLKAYSVATGHYSVWLLPPSADFQPSKVFLGPAPFCGMFVYKFA